MAKRKKAKKAKKKSTKKGWSPKKLARYKKAKRAFIDNFK